MKEATEITKLEATLTQAAMDLIAAAEVLSEYRDTETDVSKIRDTANDALASAFASLGEGSQSAEAPKSPSAHTPFDMSRLSAEERAIIEAARPVLEKIARSDE